jgi:hypothetical protein
MPIAPWVDARSQMGSNAEQDERNHPFPPVTPKLATFECMYQAVHSELLKHDLCRCADVFPVSPTSITRFFHEVEQIAILWISMWKT